jgi:tetratricopeptide (TPR) repeat protein
MSPDSPSRPPLTTGLIITAVLAAGVIAVLPPLLLKIPLLWFVAPVLGVLAGLAILFRLKFLLILTASLVLAGFLAAGFINPIPLSQEQEEKLNTMGEFITAEVFYTRKQYDSALVHYQQAEMRGLDDTWVQFQRGRCHLNLLQDYVSVEIFGRLKNEYEKIPLNMTLTSYAVSALKSRDYESGVRWYNKAIEYHFDPASAYYQLGIYYRMTGDQVRADEMITYAHKLGYDRSHCSSILGNIAESRRDLSRAEEFYHRSIRENAENLSSYTKLGSLLYRQGRLEEALDILLEGKELADWIPTFNPLAEAMLYNNLGFVFAELGNLPNSVASFRQAMLIHPTLMDSYDNLAYLYIQNGLYYEAEGVLREALRVNPGHFPARRMLEQLYAPRVDTSGTGIR